MLSYKSAKQLKEAGFPQEAKGGAFWVGEKESIKISDLKPGGIIKLKDPNGLLYCPTLSELIKACGDGFDRLKRRGENDWYVAGPLRGKGIVYENVFANAKIPEEAVKELWLKLNPPKK